MIGSFLEDAVRSLFSRVLDRDDIYLANHSLGRPPDRMHEDVQRALDLWYRDMDEGWGPWMEEMDLWRTNIARLLGFTRSDCVVPKTSAGQGLRAVLNAVPTHRPVRVLTTTGEFDSVDFILKTYAHLGRAEVEWVGPTNSDGPVPLYEVGPLIEALQAQPFDLVVVSQVFFTTAQILKDVESLVEAAHSRDVLVLLDIYHAAGVIPLSLERHGLDFAIGGSYKYLRGGPGACYLAIHPRHLDGSLRSLDTGWFAKKNTFGYERAETPQWADGGDGWLESTPPILMPYQAKAGLELVLELGVKGLRQHSLALQVRMREIFSSAGVQLFQPEDPTGFGAYSLLPHPEAPQFSKMLKGHGVNTDARGGFVRFGPDFLTTGSELQRAAALVAGAL